MTGGVEQARRRRAHFTRAVGHGLQEIFGALAERRDRVFDYGAALFLLLHGRALLLGLPPLGDVLVRADPAAALHRMIRDQQETSARGLDLVLDGAPLSNRGQKFFPVFLRIARERALGDPSRQHLGQRGSRFYVGRRQVIHLHNIASCRRPTAPRHRTCTALAPCCRWRCASARFPGADAG